MRRIALVRLLVVPMVGGLFFGALAGTLPRPAAPARAQTAGDPALLPELAQRLLSLPSADPSARAQLFPGALPPTLAAPMPLPPDGRLIGSAILPARGPGGSASTSIVVDTLLSPADALTFYQTTLTSQGWTVPAGGFHASGFLPTAPPAVASYCLGPTGPSLSVVVRPQPSGPNDLRLDLTDSDPYRCNPQAAPGPIAPPTGGLLPALAPPDGVTIAGSTFGGDDANQTASATAQTSLSAADLEQAYAQQLVAAGWTPAGSGGDATFTWSSWTLPGDTPRQGLLTVWAGSAGDQQLLELRVMTPGGIPGRSGSGVTVIATAPAPVTTATP